MNEATTEASFDFEALRVTLTGQVDEIVSRYEDSRSALIPIAQLYQEHEGWLSPQAIAAIAERLSLPRAVVESTISFYTLFYRKPVGRYMLQVCRNLSCIINGADTIMAHVRARLGIEHLETTEDGVFSYEEVECLAACDRAPCMQINLRFKYDLTPAMIDDMLAAMRAGNFDIPPLAQTAAPGRTWMLEHDERPKSLGGVGVSDPDNAGGIGDQSGRVMFDLISSDPGFAARSKERLVHEPGLRPSENGGHHA